MVKINAYIAVHNERKGHQQHSLSLRKMLSLAKCMKKVVQLNFCNENARKCYLVESGSVMLRCLSEVLGLRPPAAYAQQKLQSAC